MKPVDMAKKFLEKAAQDEVLLDKILQDREVEDWFFQRYPRLARVIEWKRKGRTR